MNFKKDLELICQQRDCKIKAIEAIKKLIALHKDLFSQYYEISANQESLIRAFQKETYVLKDHYITNKESDIYSNIIKEKNLLQEKKNKIELIESDIFCQAELLKNFNDAYDTVIKKGELKYPLGLIVDKENKSEDDRALLHYNEDLMQKIRIHCDLEDYLESIKKNARLIEEIKTNITIKDSEVADVNCTFEHIMNKVRCEIKFRRNNLRSKYPSLSEKDIQSILKTDLLNKEDWHIY